jgi:hypothetical protein
MWKNWNSYTLLEEMQIGVPTIEKNCQLPKKLNIGLLY